MASKQTKDHDFIREWAEKRGGRPAEVESTEKNGQTGILRLEFPGAPNANDAALKEIEWDDFFEKFDASGLEFLYQEETADGEQSNFNKLVYPEPDSKEGKALLRKSAKRRSSSKKAAPKKSSSVKPAAKTTAKKTTAKTSAKNAAKKATAKKTVAKKAAAKKVAAKKTVAKKAAAKKSTAKKVAAKKTTAKKTVAKKAAPKKTAAKKSTRR